MQALKLLKRYHLEVTTDKQNLKIKKKYSDLKRFSQEVQKNLSIKGFALQPHLRTQQQYKSIQILVKKLNTTYLQINPDKMSQKQVLLRRQIRVFLYNTLFYIDEINSDQQTTPRVKPSEQKTQISESNQIQTQIKDQKSNERSLRTKSKALAASLVSNVLKRMQVQPMKQILKNINIIWMKQHSTFVECRLYLTQSSLILHKRSSNTRIILIICKLTIQLLQQPYFRILLSHPLLSQNLELRLSNINQKEGKIIQNQVQQAKVKDQFANKYLALYSALKTVSNRQRQVQVYNFVKITITITTKTIQLNSFFATKPSINESGQPQKKIASSIPISLKEVGIKLVHHTLSATFTLASSSICQIYLPIVSNYSFIELLVSQTKQPGAIPSFKQSLTQSLTIPVQNIYDLLYNFDRPKCKSLDIRQLIYESKSTCYNLNLAYQELGTRESYWAYDSVNDKFQGNTLVDDPNKDEVRIQFNRLKRIIWTMELYASSFNDLKRFSNPILSYIFYLTIVCLILFTNMNFLPHLFLLSILVTMCYKHPSLKSWLKQILEYFNLLKHYKPFKQILFVRHGDLSGYEVNFKFDMEKRRFLENFQLTMKKKRNIYKKFKRLHEILLKAQTLLMELVNFIEKIKNIIVWYHHKKSYLVFVLLLFILIIITFIPVRLILLLIVLKTFQSGRKFKKSTKQHNWQVIREIYLQTILQNKLQDEMMHYLSQQSKQLNKKSSQYISFQKKVKQNLLQFLQIEFSPRIFQDSKTLHQSINHLSNCKKRFYLSIAICQKYQITNTKFIWKEGILGLILRAIIGFVGVIPSDRNILGTKNCQVQDGKEGQPVMDANIYDGQSD